MGSFTFGIGKGLREPCSPYREVNVFGATLNSPSAVGWNCLPSLVSKTTSFDLSGITKNREVAVALLGITNTREGTYRVRFRWFRERDNKLLYDYTFSYSAVAGGWMYAYSYIGWVDWEINENGQYSVSVSVSGPESYSNTIYFSVSGVTVPVPTPPPTPVTGTSIVEALNSVSSYFYSIYREVLGWVYPFWYIATFFYWLSSLFSTLAYGASDFFTSFNELWAKATNILSWDNIWSYILSYIPNLVNIRDWFYDWWGKVKGVVLEWWSATQWTVRGWIDVAVTGIQSLINGVNVGLISLQSAWDSFKGRIPTIEQMIYWWGNWQGFVLQYIDTWWAGALLDVQSLINSAFLARQSLWAGWQDFRDQVIEFFTDPEQWLYDRLDSFFERFW